MTVLPMFLFVMALRTSQAGLHSTVTALPCADCKTEAIGSLLPIPTHMWAVANQVKLSNEGQLSEYSLCRQFFQCFVLGLEEETHKVSCPYLILSNVRLAIYW